MRNQVRTFGTRPFTIPARIIVVTCLSSAGAAQIKGWNWTPGGAEETLDVWRRAGFAPLTQSLTVNSSTDVGSLGNLQGLYGLNTWLLPGVSVEWERHVVERDLPHIVELGHQDTVSLLPTVEVCPGRLDPTAPYVSMGFGPM